MHEPFITVIQKPEGWVPTIMAWDYVLGQKVIVPPEFYELELNCNSFDFLTEAAMWCICWSLDNPDFEYMSPQQVKIREGNI